MTDSLIFVAVALHLLWLAAAGFAFMGWRRLRALGALSLVPMTQLRPGMEARVQGRLAFAGAERTSPLGGVPAVWFDWKVERRSDAARDPVMAGRRWITVASGSATQPFALVDQAGNRLLVWPDKADALDVPEQSWDGEYPDTIDTAQRDGLLRDVDPADIGALLFTERWLPSGGPCVVIGRVEAAGPEHGPGVRGLIRAGGAHAFVIAAGVTADSQALLRRRTTFAALIALAALVFAVLASIYA